MKFYKHLYLTEDLEKKKNKIIRKVEQNKLQLSISLIVLPGTAQNQLEIIDSNMFLQPSYPKKDYFVVGMASGYDASLELVEKILQDIYADTNGTDIRNYILKKEQE